MEYHTILALLVFGHFLCDYPLQGTWIATTKDHTNPHPSGYPWYQSLTAHSVIHGGAVGIITGSLLLGFLEFVIHWIIDFAKSDGAFGVNFDQFLHIMWKIVWVSILFLLET